MIAMQGWQGLTLPGWHGSGPQHWQSRWEQLYGYRRVQQHDWQQPLRGDWMIQLEEAVLACRQPVVLVAHSLGCWLTAAWAAHSQHAHKVVGAMLVAPPDAAMFHVEPILYSWRPTVVQQLPFASLLVSSSDDPYCSTEQAQALATAWGSRWQPAGAHGHLNADSALDDWPQGHDWLQQWLAGMQDQTSKE